MNIATYRIIHEMHAGILPEIYKVGAVVAKREDDSVWVIDKIEIVEADESNDDFVDTAYIDCRPADEAEVAAFRERVAAATARRAKQQRVAAIKREFLILALATKPENACPAGLGFKSPGEPLVTLYADVDCLWHVRENGGDGDDWSRNNAPGAIVHRFDNCPEILELVPLLFDLGMAL